MEKSEINGGKNSGVQVMVFHEIGMMYLSKKQVTFK
jgi:hypothetical protein